MKETHSPTTNPLGFQYYPDSAHYTHKDLNAALEHLHNLGAGWLVLHAEASRAIPETFISGLLAAAITPIIHLPLSLPNAPAAADLKAILNAYGKWGANYVLLFDRPNDRTSWSAAGWSQTNLVESFLDRFIPLANECLAAGLTPIFPALTPGGSYWDLSFFTLALQSLQRRNQKALLNKMALAAYACSFGHSIDWGKDGAAAWPQNKPYFTPAAGENQIGFNQAIWLEEIAEKILGQQLPLFLLGLGRKDLATPNSYSDSEQANWTREIKSTLPELAASLPLLAGNFWLLQSTAVDENASFAWIAADGEVSPSYRVFADLPNQDLGQAAAKEVTTHDSSPMKSSCESNFPIRHYLLLPKYEWGIADWHLEVIKPFVRKHQPTIGFSLEEAALAAIVTVVGSEAQFSDEDLNELRKAGATVDRISGDGTSIATQLSER
jgi:hypothetical protein